MITRDQITPVHSGIMSGLVSLLGIGVISFVGTLQTISIGDLALWGVIQLTAFVIWFSWYRQLPEPTQRQLDVPGGAG